MIHPQTRNGHAGGRGRYSGCRSKKATKGAGITFATVPAVFLRRRRQSLNRNGCRVPFTFRLFPCELGQIQFTIGGRRTCKLGVACPAVEANPCPVVLRAVHGWWLLLCISIYYYIVRWLLLTSKRRTRRRELCIPMRVGPRRSARSTLSARCEWFQFSGPHTPRRNTCLQQRQST